MSKLLELLEKLVRAIFGPGDERDTGEPEPTPQAPKAEAVTGWEGDPPLPVHRREPVSGPYRLGARWQRQATREQCSGR